MGGLDATYDLGTISAKSQEPKARSQQVVMKDIRSVGDIRLMVDVLYERAGSDELLGPIFMNIKDSVPYKELLYRYWENEILNPHNDVRELLPEHISRMSSTRQFIRWLELFLQTIDSLYAGAVADKARVILIRKSEEFQMKLELSRF